VDNRCCQTFGLRGIVAAFERGHLAPLEEGIISAGCGTPPNRSGTKTVLLLDRVKVLLRNFETAQYLASDSWVVDGGSAFDFGKPEQAIQFTQQHSLEKMEVVLRYDNPIFEMAIPVPSSAGAAHTATKPGFF
jgi:hypothetical protein